jgi:hypothetical protein
LKFVLPGVSREALLALSCLLGLSIVLLSLWVVYLHRTQARFQNYHFDPIAGLLRDRPNGQKRFCTRCLLQRNQEVPLGFRKEDSNWICMRGACMTVYRD